MPTIDLTLGSVAYREFGPEHVAAPVAVFVHGFLVNGTLWDRVAEKLAAGGVRSVVPDWPLGSHRTPASPGGDLSPRGIGAGILELLETLDLHDVVLVGNDTGGALCQLALQGDTSRVGGLVLTNCDAFEQFPPPALVPLFVLARYKSALKVLLQPMRVRAVRDSFLGFGPLLSHPVSADLTRQWIQPLLDQPAVRADVARFARGVQRTELVDSAKWLRRFDRPVRILWGTKDRMFKSDLGRRLAEVFPESELRELDGVTTFVPYDQPDAVVEAVRELVGRTVG